MPGRPSGMGEEDGLSAPRAGAVSLATWLLKQNLMGSADGEPTCGLVSDRSGTSTSCGAASAHPRAGAVFFWGGGWRERTISLAVEAPPASPEKEPATDQQQRNDAGRKEQQRRRLVTNGI